MYVCLPCLLFANTATLVILPTPTPTPAPVLVTSASLTQAQAQAFIAASLAVVTLPNGKQATDILSGSFVVNADGTATIKVRLKP